MFHVKQIAATNQIFKLSYTQLRHQYAQLFGYEEKVVHHMFRLASKFFAQLRVLRSHAHWTMD